MKLIIVNKIVQPILQSYISQDMFSKVKRTRARTMTEINLLFAETGDSRCSGAMFYSPIIHGTLQPCGGLEWERETTNSTGRIPHKPRLGYIYVYHEIRGCMTVWTVYT